MKYLIKNKHFTYKKNNTYSAVYIVQKVTTKCPKGA